MSSFHVKKAIALPAIISSSLMIKQSCISGLDLLINLSEINV